MKIFSKTLLFLCILSVVFIFSIEYKTSIVLSPTNCSGKTTINIDGTTQEIDLSKRKTLKIKKKSINDISFSQIPTDICQLNIKMKGKHKKQLNGFNFKNLNFKSKIHFNFNKILTLSLTLLFFTIYFNSPDPKQISAVVSTNASERFYNLDFLRLIFMGQIIYTHLSLPLKFNFSIVGYTEYFFILSGFFMFLTFKPEKSAFDFTCNKIIRWWPLMIWGILIRLCIRGEFAGSVVLSELLFLPLTGISDVGINQPDWFLAVLFWSSLFYFLLLKAFDQNKFDLLLFLIIASCALIFVRGTYDLYNMQMIRGVLGVGLGCFIAKIYTSVNERLIQNQNKINLFFVTILELFVLLNAFFCKNWLFVIFSNAFLIFLFALRKGYISSFFNTKYAACLGKYVLAIFLTHGFIVNEFLPLLVKDYPQILSHKPVTIVLTYVLVLLFGIISHNIFEEKPNVLKRVLLKNNQR